MHQGIRTVRKVSDLRLLAVLPILELSQEQRFITTLKMTELRQASVI